MDPFYQAISLFRRRKYEECIEICNKLLATNALHQGPWELKMRAMTQRWLFLPLYFDTFILLDVDNDTLT